MRRAQKDYEDKQMSTQKPPAGAPQQPTQKPPTGAPVDVRPSEREAVEAARSGAEGQGKPRPSEAEAAEERAKAMEEAEEQEAEKAP